MTNQASITFQDAGTMAFLVAAKDAALDELDFGVIGFDMAGIVVRYNTFESKASGLSLDSVISKHFFNVVAPCMNNFLVAHKFEEASDSNEPLDVTIDYVLTFRMRPTKVKLRLLSLPGASVRYVLVQRRI